MTAPRLSPERIEEIRARLEAATPGPWRLGFPLGRCALDHAHRFGHCNYRFTNWLDSDSIASDPGFRPGDQYHDTTVIAPADGSTPERADLALIANAPADLSALLREMDLLRADATATMDAAARGAQVPLGYLSDLAAARCRAGNAEDERDAAERERDLLAETARRLTGERDELAADIDLRDNGPRCITCGEYMGGRASFWGNEAEHYECAVPPQDGESPAAHWKRIRDERQAMVAAAQEAPNA